MSELFTELLGVKDMKQAWKKKPLKTSLLAFSLAAVFALGILIGALISKVLPDGISKFLFDSDSILSLAASSIFWLILLGFVFLFYWFILGILIYLKKRKNQ